jgi:predicted nicotinamide N-methyase
MKGPHHSFVVRDVVALKPNHYRVRELRERGVEPSEFGSRIWRSSYLLVDYHSRQHFTSDDHVMEIGCGWGLPSQYLQKTFGIPVTATDGDARVGQYLALLSQENRTEVRFRQRRFSELSDSELAGVTTLVGADICYAPRQCEDLVALANRFLARPGRRVILADSGRRSFFELAERLQSRWRGNLEAISLQTPTAAQGYILHLVTR